MRIYNDDNVVITGIDQSIQTKIYEALNDASTAIYWPCMHFPDDKLDLLDDKDSYINRHGSFQICPSRSKRDIARLRNGLYRGAMFMERVRACRWTNDVMKKLKKANVIDRKIFIQVLNSGILNHRLQLVNEAPFSDFDLRIYIII